MSETKLDSSGCSAWTTEDAERLEYLYFHGGDKGDMPISYIAEQLGRTEKACRSKLSRMFKQRRRVDES